MRVAKNYSREEMCLERLIPERCLTIRISITNYNMTVHKDGMECTVAAFMNGSQNHLYSHRVVSSRFRFLLSRWVVDDPAQLATARAANADGVISNDPIAIQAALCRDASKISSLL